MTRRPKVTSPAPSGLRWCYAGDLRPGDVIRTTGPIGVTIDETVRTVNHPPSRVVYLTTAAGRNRYRYAWPDSARVDVVRFNDEDPDTTRTLPRLHRLVDPAAGALARRQADPHPFDPNREADRDVDSCAWCALPEEAEIHAP